MREESSAERLCSAITTLRGCVLRDLEEERIKNTLVLFETKLDIICCVHMCTHLLSFVGSYTPQNGRYGCTIYHGRGDQVVFTEAEWDKKCPTPKVEAAKFVIQHIVEHFETAGKDFHAACSVFPLSTHALNVTLMTSSSVFHRDGETLDKSEHTD